MKSFILAALFAIIALPAYAAIFNAPPNAAIKVYSGGQVIYQGVLGGPLTTSDNGNFASFSDKCANPPNSTVVVSGDVVVTPGTGECPAGK